MKKLLFILAVGISIPSLAQEPLDCENMCVTSIVMNTEGGLLDITIFNGDVQINYPIVTVVVDGDTVGNINQQFYFFAQLPNQSVTHTIPTILTSVPADFVCTVIISDNIYFTECQLEYPCVTNNLDYENNQPEIKLYPNPANDRLSIAAIPGMTAIRILDLAGRVIIDQTNFIGGDIDISHLEPGQYQLNIMVGDKKSLTTGFIKQ
jgi:archaellum component FlaF (FlaF/FlaG flagellin family)